MAQRVLNTVTTSGPTQTITGNKIFNALIRANGNIDSFVGAVNVNRIDLGLASNSPRIVFENTNNIWFNDITSAGTLRWATPGNERVTLSSSGNMGLGITGGTALAKLQIASGGLVVSSNSAIAPDPGAGNLRVTGTGLFNSAVSVDANLGTAPALNLKNTDTADGRCVISLFQGHITPYRYDLGIHNAGIFILRDQNASGTPFRLSVSPAGNVGVGIGLASSNARLQVAGGVAITSSVAAATDPGAGNLSVAGRTQTGGLRVGARIVTANAAITTAGCLLYIDASANAIDLTLPTAIGNLGTLFILIRTDNSANIVRVLTSVTGQTINNSTNPFTIPGGASFNFSSNDANWFVF